MTLFSGDMYNNERRNGEKMNKTNKHKWRYLREEIGRKYTKTRKTETINNAIEDEVHSYIERRNREVNKP